jgi:hypothetical protein
MGEITKTKAGYLQIKMERTGETFWISPSMCRNLLLLTDESNTFNEVKKTSIPAIPNSAPTPPSRSSNHEHPLLEEFKNTLTGSEEKMEFSKSLEMYKPKDLYKKFMEDQKKQENARYAKSEARSRTSERGESDNETQTKRGKSYHDFESYAAHLSPEDLNPTFPKHTPEKRQEFTNPGPIEQIKYHDPCEKLEPPCPTDSSEEIDHFYHNEYETLAPPPVDSSEEEERKTNKE